MLVGLTLGAACAGGASVAVGPASLTSVLLGEASPLTTAPAVTQQLGAAAGHEQNSRLVTSTGVPAETTTTSPAATTTTTATSTTTTTSEPPTSTTTGAKPTTTAGDDLPKEPGPRVIALVNKHRTEIGCKALTEDKRLDTAAQKHSDDMQKNNYFSHTSLDGRSFVDRERAEGYPSPGGENIAEGYPTAEAVFKGWMDSDGHRRNIEDCSFTTIGMGVTTTGWYWVQDFGR